MTWIKWAFTAIKGYLPSVSMTTVYALACALVCATSGVIGWRLGQYHSQQSQIAAMEHAIEQSQAIAAQDAEILAATATVTRTIYQTREAAHAALNAATTDPTPDCQLNADGLRAVQSVYQSDANRSHAIVDLVRAAYAPGGREARDAGTFPDRRRIGVSGVRETTQGAE